MASPARAHSRPGAPRLSVAEERGQHRGGDLSELHDPGNDDFRQRIYVRGGGDEHSGYGDEHVSDTDGESGAGSAGDLDAAGESDGDGRADGHVHGHRDRHRTARLPVAEERGQHRWSDSSELHDPGNHDFGQRLGIRGGGDEHGGYGDQRFSDADGESGAGSAGDLDAAGESDGDGGADGHVHGHRDRDGAARLPVAEERGQHRGGDVKQLHDPGDDDFRQRVGVRGGGEQLRRYGDERSSNTDGESGAGSAGDLDAAGESDRDGGADGHVHSGGDRDGAARLPVAEERGEHQRGDSSELHDPGNHDFRQRVSVRGGGDEHRGDGNEQCGDTDGESGPGSPHDHHAAGEPGGDGGTDGHVHGGGDRHSTARLPVAEERSQHRGSDSGELHDPGNHDFRQRIGVRGGGDEHGRYGDQRLSDTDGESSAGSAGNHEPAGEPDGDGGADGHVHGGSDRDGAARLPVAEERGQHQWGDSSKLHDPGDDDSGQRLGVRGGGDEHSGYGDEHVSDTDGESGTGSADD